MNPTITVACILGQSVVRCLCVQLEALLRDKVKNNYYEVRKRFKDNDPDGRGNVSKSVL